MIFEWDEQKNTINIERHGIDFADAHIIFDRPMLRRVDGRRDYGEVRWICLGRLDDGVVVIVYTIRHGVIRIISLRRANRNERKIYEEKFGK